MSASQKAKSIRIDYSQRQFIKRKALSPTIPSHPKNSLVIGLTNEVIHITRPNPKRSNEKTPSASKEPVKTHKNPLIRSERKPAKDFEESSAASFDQVQYYQYKISSLTRAVQEKDEEIKRLKETVNEIHQGNPVRPQIHIVTTPKNPRSASVLDGYSADYLHGMGKKVISTGNLISDFSTVETIRTPNGKLSNGNSIRESATIGTVGEYYKGDIRQELLLLRERMETKFSHAQKVIKQLVSLLKAANPKIDLTSIVPQLS